MRASRAGWVVIGVVAVAGCGEGPPPDPLPTDGPNQVVFFVPTMT